MMPRKRCTRLIGRKPRAKSSQFVLHVALAPAAVAFGAVDERGRALLVAALEVGRDPHLPAGPLRMKGGLDEIVAEDAAAEGFATGQVGQAAMIHERLHADDGVVAPVVCRRAAASS